MTAVPTLQALAVDFVASNIDAVEDFGFLTPAVQHALTSELCRRRLFGDAQLKLLAPEGLPLSELIAPDCHRIETEALHDCLTPLTEPGSRLGMLSLGFCGRCVTAETTRLIARIPALHSLRCARAMPSWTAPNTPFLASTRKCIFFARSTLLPPKNQPPVATLPHLPTYPLVIELPLFT